ncbi:MAG: hydroxymethylbilane synthase [Lachnospiraceae bacterium]|nr:hydroxymethylbilane synthase [Lachnospiraceae bacterium]
MNKILKIGTRKSALALVQTKIVQKKIEDAFPEIKIEIVKMSTKGDRNQTLSLASFGGKGVFTKELEEALLSGEIDLAVHSAKDLPLEFPEGLGICAVLEREDPRDVIVTRTGVQLSKLPKGSVLGTSSLRRELQAANINPDIRVKVLRGNVHTRLQKLKDGEYDAIVMAAAGLKRSKLDSEEGLFYEYLDPMEFLPAVGQGILAVEGRSGDLEEITSAIHDNYAADILKVERDILKVIGGGCNAPIAAYTRTEKETMIIRAMYAKDGRHPAYTEISGKKGSDLGKKAGERLCQRNNLEK